MADEAKNPQPGHIKPSASVAGSRHFMFATGIENSYPTIQLPDGTIKRVDEMEKTFHYRRLAPANTIGISPMRRSMSCANSRSSRSRTFVILACLTGSRISKTLIFQSISRNMPPRSQIVSRGAGFTHR